MALSDVVDALTAHGCDPKGGGDRYGARCPAHDDRNPSLSVDYVGDKVLLCCHAGDGCAPEAILTALNLPWDALFDSPPERSNGSTVVATYDYTDEAGALLFQVVRKSPKDFRQRRPDPTAEDGWAWKLNGTRRVLYRLPAVVTAVAEGQPVWIAEGEKDVHALERAGVVATCNPMGAGSWRPEYSPVLKGAEIVIVADRDEKGRKHAEEVAAALEGVARSVRRVEAAVGKDASDHLAAGKTIEEFARASKVERTDRHIVLTDASTIAPRPVKWLWRDRMPLGELTLLGGREGIGKSSVAYTMAAWITTGNMKGEFCGQPRAVIVVATEDSWSHTIVPRLMAAGADLKLVYRVDVVTSEGLSGTLTLPSDVAAMERAVKEVDAAFVLLDPLMSRLSTSLDTHKDAEVRTALEPLTAFAHSAGIAVLGIIHVNKGSSVDPLTLIMGSRAFPAVARAVLVAMKDPEDESRVLLGLEKSNLGRRDLPTFVYRIASELVASTDEGPIYTGKVVWLDETNRSVAEAMAAAGEGPGAASATSECAEWLEDYLQSSGGGIDSATVKEAAKKQGHSGFAMRHARKRLGVLTESFGFPRRTYWMLPGSPSPDASSRVGPLGRLNTTDMTDTTESDQGVCKDTHSAPASSRVGRVGRVASPGGTDTTGETQTSFDTLPLVATRSNGIGSGVTIDEFGGI